MKNYYSLLVALSIATITMFSLTSCQKEDDVAIGIKEGSKLNPRSNPNSAIYPFSSHPFGKSHAEWAEEFWLAAMALDCEGFNTDQVLTLDDNVDTYFGALITGESNITLSRDKAFFIPLVTILNDYPCPDPDFEPAEGQSLEDFLREGAIALIDGLENLEVILDGVALENLYDSRLTTDLFYFTGNPELATCVDPCVTGESQAGVVNGYFIMFKKLQPGQHTIIMRGEYPVYEFEWEMTLNITVI